MFDPIVRGGVVMIPLILCSIVALVISIERWLYLRHARVDTEGLMGKIRAALGGGSVEQARGICQATPGPVARVLGASLAHFGMPKDDLREVAREAALAEMPVLDGRLPVLATMVTVAPLLGLLGTISGLIKVFHVIAGGGIGDATALSAGIAEALITTFAGLTIAIPFLIIYNSLSGRVEALTHEMELRVTELLNLQTAGAKQ
ncbi:MAG: MotA/TolQ/ExbB proton channel family protein [Armatimonadota bacterium]